jgi:hypothetical protein
MNNFYGIKLNHIYGFDIEEAMTHYDVVFSRIESVDQIRYEKDVPYPVGGVQNGLQNCHGQIMISIIRAGSFVFDLKEEVPHPDYLAEKLNIDTRSAAFIRNWIIKTKAISKSS